MAINQRRKRLFFNYLKNIFFISVLLASCTIPRQIKYWPNVKNKKEHGRDTVIITQKHIRVPFTKPFVYKNNIDLVGKFSSDEKINIKQRLYGQLDDSSRTTVKDAFFFLHYIDNPPSYDSGYAAVSANNMKGSMVHLGYYHAEVNFKSDTTTRNKTVISFRFKRKRFPWYHFKEIRVTTTYTVIAGKPTLIDTVSFQMSDSALEQLALKTKDQSNLQKNQPITKENVLNEIGRLVTLYRNSGYYKITSDDIKVIGDTTISLLTNASDDPLENLIALEAAKAQRDRPTIKLAIILNPLAEKDHLKKYYFDSVIIHPDYSAEDASNPYDKLNIQVTKTDSFIIVYHKKLFRTGVIIRNMAFKKGDAYNQENYAKTINSFSKAGVWQSVVTKIVDNKKNDSINVIIELVPVKKYGFEADIEGSYSFGTNVSTATVATAGNLLGVSLNTSFQNRNFLKKAIKWTNAFHIGQEWNLNAPDNTKKVNSNEFGYTPTFTIPQLIHLLPVKRIDTATNRGFIWERFKEWWRWKRIGTQETYLTANASFVNRIDLFNLQNYSVSLNESWTTTKHPNITYNIKFLNIEFSYLYNQSDLFTQTLHDNPYLHYSFNTALVMGEVFNFSWNKNPISRKPFNLKVNLEESGNFWGNAIGKNFIVFNKYLHHYIKGDIEGTKTWVSFNAKRQFIIHGFVGVGIPTNKKDSTLPFFKQYFSGGSNSMRGWPVRGLGIGGQPLPPYNPDVILFNDRTGDIKFEANLEYRHDIATIIPGTLSLKGALFYDMGNIWNYKYNRTDGFPDTTQFQFKNFYKQLAADVGYGFRFDFNYFVLRFDLGIRVKKPDVQDGSWQFSNVIRPNFFNKRWRYENFNFNIGISYPFQ